MKRKVFQDSVLQSTFDAKGYVTIPFLSASEVDELLDFYSSNDSGLKGGYHSSMFSKSVEYRTKAHQLLYSYVNQKQQNILDRHKIIICTFLVKDPDHMSRVGLHCDWSLTDESKFQSIILWVPLCDVDEHNGAMYMLDGSHHDTNTIRGEGIPVPYDTIPDEFVREHMTLVPVKKGDAVIFDLSVLHCSFPNVSQSPRIAFNVGLIPEEAPSLHYFVDENTPAGMYDIYKADEGFYLSNNIGKRMAEAEFLGRKQLVFDGITKEELMKKYSAIHV